MDWIRLNGGYAPIYSEKAEILLLGRDFRGFLVLYILGYHADPYGVCQAGLERIRAFSGGTRQSVAEALLRLQARDYVREHHTVNRLRHKTEIDYQISPGVIFVREECLEEAWQIWTSCTTPQIEVQIEQSQNSDIFDNNQNQPEPEPAPKTSSKSAPPPDSHFESEEFISPTRAESQDRKSEEQKDGKDRTHQRAAPPAPQGAPTKTPPRSARPPSSQRRKDFSKPLIPPMEALAKQVAQVAPTHISQARQLVYTYRGEFVEAGLVRLKAAIAKGGANKPFGLIKTWLERDQIDPGNPLAPLKRISGDIDDFIER
jgi:hypothetical protein